MIERSIRATSILGIVFVLMANRANSAELIARFSMEEMGAPLVDTVSGLVAQEREGGHVYSVPGPVGFGNAVGLTDLGAWVLSVDDSAALRDLENDFTVAAWVYVDSVVGADKPDGGAGVNRIMGDADNWDADGWAWGIQNDGRILFTKNGIIDAWSLGGLVVQDEWTHVAVTVSIDDGLTYYVNGSEADNLSAETGDLNLSPGNNGMDDFWGIGQANTPTNEQWFAGNLDEVRVYSDVLTPGEIVALLEPETSTALKAGDADMDFDFDQLDLVQVQIAAKYLTGQPANWSEGDWTAPGGEPGNPPPGDNLFNQQDIIAALAANIYLAGPYNAVQPGGQRNDEKTTIVYDPSSGELAVDAPASTELTSINIDSAAGIFTGDAAENLGGSFDNDADNNIFKATFGSSFGSLSFGNVAQTGLSEAFLLDDLTVVGSLAGGGDLGEVDLVYVPEPASILLLAIGLGFSLVRFRTITSR